ncbi:MAG: hypothetical protein HRU75_13565 [Planctomycetia bacterium]|nr:MAG: hypothetical protein HRU75_13565 [Planctomycetia bacterium]
MPERRAGLIAAVAVLALCNGADRSVARAQPGDWSRAGGSGIEWVRAIHCDNTDLLLVYTRAGTLDLYRADDGAIVEGSGVAVGRGLRFAAAHAQPPLAPTAAQTAAATAEECADAGIELRILCFDRSAVYELAVSPQVLRMTRRLGSAFLTPDQAPGDPEFSPAIIDAGVTSIGPVALRSDGALAAFIEGPPMLLAGPGKSAAPRFLLVDPNGTALVLFTAGAASQATVYAFDDEAPAAESATRPPAGRELVLERGAGVLASHVAGGALIVITRDRAEIIPARDEHAPRVRIPGARFRADGVAFVRRARPISGAAAAIPPTDETLLLRSTVDGRIWAWRIPGGDIAWRTPPGALRRDTNEADATPARAAPPRLLDSQGAWSCWLHEGCVWGIRNADGLIGGTIALPRDGELLCACVRDTAAGPSLMIAIRDGHGVAALELPIFAPGEKLRAGGNQLRNRAVDHPPRVARLPDAPDPATAILLADRVVLHDADQLRVYHLRRSARSP